MWPSVPLKTDIDPKRNWGMDRCQVPNCTRPAYVALRMFRNRWFPDLIHVCQRHRDRWYEQDEQAFLNGERPVRLHGFQFEKTMKWYRVAEDGSWERIPRPKTVKEVKHGGYFDEEVGGCEEPEREMPDLLKKLLKNRRGG